MPTTIRLGDTGQDVKRLQRVFARMKILAPENVDGVFGRQTERLVKDFQQSNGLVVDGVVGPIAWSHVNPYREASPVLQAGSLGPVVAMLQRVLKTVSVTLVPSMEYSVQLPKPSFDSSKPTPASRSRGSWTNRPGWRPPAARGQRSRASQV